MYPRFLSKEYPLDKHFFFVTRYSFSLLGLHFEKPMNWLAQIWLVFNVFNLAHCCQAEFAFGWYYLSINIMDCLDAFCPLATSFTTLFKLVYMWYFRKEVAQIITRVRQLTERQHNEEHQILKRLYYTRATRLGMWVFTVATATTLSFVLRSLWEIYLNLRSELPFKYDMPFRMFFPAIGHRMPLYPFFFSYSAWSGQVTVYTFTGTDCFFLSFTFYITFLLKALKTDVLQTLREVQDPSPKDCELCCQRLVNIIDRHNEIVDIVHKFSKLVSATTFAHFVSSSLVIATSIIGILLSSSYNILRYMLYAATVLSVLWLYCFGGSQLTTASLEVGEAIYCSHWYTWNREVRRRAYLLILRSQRPISIQVPFFAPSLPVFTSIIKFTGSIVALAKTIL